ncbi:MAG: stage II sporulation protein M [Nanoarchaeota archaeon]
MVLERLVKVRNLESKPWELFLLGLVWTAFAAGISLYLFPAYASLVSVTFTVMLTLPFVYTSMAREEEIYHDPHGELSLIRAHSHLFVCFVSLFLGILAAYILWFVLGPDELVADLFAAQAATIANVNGATGNVVGISTFWIIFWHNMRILLVSTLLAFFLGAGPIFILTWNASVIATAVGSQFRDGIDMLAAAQGTLSWSDTLFTMAFPFTRYLLHGVPEILAYIIGGLAGGLISIAVIRHKFGSSHFLRTMGDAFTMLVLSILILAVAGIIEVRVLAGL